MTLSDDEVGQRLAARLRDVRSRIDAAARRSGRDPDEITLVAVSKTKPASDVEAAYRAGQRVFGENYAQELAEKSATLAHLGDLEWHFIGRLQTNKAKYVARVATLVHAVDSMRLADELGKRTGERTTPLSVLVEVNLGDEASKGGVRADELGALLRHIEGVSSLRLRGLMCIPPHVSHDASAVPGEAARPFHQRLRSLRDAHGGATRLPVLSMGMTDDLEVAVEEGATMVRVGTAIFGARG